MPLTLLNHTTTKPLSGPLKIDVANPLGYKLAAFWLFNSAFDNTFDSSLHGQTLVKAGTVNQVGTQEGQAVQGNGTTGKFSIADIRPVFNQSHITTWFRMITKQTAAFQSMGGVRVGFNYYLTHFSNSQQIEARNSIGGTTADVGFTMGADGLHSFGMSYDGTTTTAWYDGVSKATSTGSTGLYTTGGSAIDYEILSDSNNNWSAEICLAAAIWQRVLTPAEQLALHVNPYAMFVPRTMQRWPVLAVSAAQDTPELRRDRQMHQLLAQ